MPATEAQPTAAQDALMDIRINAANLCDAASGAHAALWSGGRADITSYLVRSTLSEFDKLAELIESVRPLLLTAIEPKPQAGSQLSLLDAA
jgi:hypothetical protein